MSELTESRARVVFAVTNQKGGVGKTTTAINLTAALAASGVRCLLIDLDPQANATAALGISKARTSSVYDVIMGELPLAQTVIQDVQPGLDLAPSTADLAGAEVELVPAMAREFRLRNAIADLESDYESIIVDCAPSLGLLTLNALAAADQILVPVQCEYLALEGLGQLTSTLDAVRRALNPELNLGGLLLTMYDSRTKLCQQVAAEVRGHFSNTFSTVIPRSIRLSEAPSHGLPINLYAGSSPAAKAYKALAKEISANFLSTRTKSEVGT